jgi:aspartate racemase
MRVLGLVGGTTWHSTVEYYSLLNRIAAERQTPLSSARCVLVSLDFAEIARNNETDMPANGRIVVDACQKLKAAGAEAIVLCANTMHMFAPDVAQVGLPIIHIGQATAIAIQQAGLSRVGLLGTRYTMEMGFLRDHLTDAGIEWVIPSDEDRAWIHSTIFDELGKGIFTESTRARYVSIIQGLGVQGAILGCTEIPLLIKPGDVSIPTFDTTAIHAQAAMDWALA